MQRRTSACSSVVHHSVYAVLLIFITVALSFSSIAYGEPFQDQERALELITSTADKICGEASTTGGVESSELQGKVQAQLRGLASKLADAGISGSGSLTSEQYKNVIREDLAANLHDIRACKLKIVDTVIALLGKGPIPPAPGTREFQLTCVSNCDSDDPSNSMAVKITVLSFVFDKDHAKTTMRIRLESERNESDCHFGAGDGFQFEDETGKTYAPDGQLKNGRSFSLVGGKPLFLNAVYSFLPSRSSLYTLHPLYIVCAERDGYTPTYGDIQIPFD